MHPTRKVVADVLIGDAKVLPENVTYEKYRDSCRGYRYADVPDVEAMSYRGSSMDGHEGDAQAAAHEHHGHVRRRGHVGQHLGVPGPRVAREPRP